MAPEISKKAMIGNIYATLNQLRGTPLLYEGFKRGDFFACTYLIDEKVSIGINFELKTKKMSPYEFYINAHRLWKEMNSYRYIEV